MKIYDHGLSPLLIKIHFTHKNFICWPIFKIFAGLFHDFFCFENHKNIIQYFRLLQISISVHVVNILSKIYGAESLWLLFIYV